MLLSIISLICNFKIFVMGDDHTRRGDMSSSKTPIDDIIEHITADLQSYDGQYILLGQPANTSNHTIWHQYNNPQSDASSQSTYLPNNINYENGRAKVTIDPNVMYTQNTFVDMSNGSFVPYILNPSSQYANSHDAHMNYLYCQQQNSPSTSNEYGLFSSSNLETRDQSILQNLRAKWVSMNPVEESFGNSFNNTNTDAMEVDISPQYYSHEQNYQLLQQQQPHNSQQRPLMQQQHLLQQQLQQQQLQQQQLQLQQQHSQPQLQQQHSQQQLQQQQQHSQQQLQQQSPFQHLQQTSVFHQQQSASLNQHTSPIGSFNNTPKKTRMVAEVRPMRPSYSDVLAKSVSPTSSATNGSATKPLSNPKTELGTRPANSVVLKQKKGSNAVKGGNILLHRQLSSGSEEQILNGLKSNTEKKTRTTNENIQWPSLEDLEKHSVYGDINDSYCCNTKSASSSSSATIFANKGNKKNARKQKTVTRQKDHATSNSLKATVNNEDRAASSNKKNAKKFTTINTSNFHWGVGKSIHHPMKHDDKKSNKTITVETSSGKKQNIGSSLSKNSNSSSSSTESTISSKTTINNKSHGRSTVSPVVQKKTTRLLKRRESPSQFGLFWKRWSKKSEEYAVQFISWFANLLWDVIVLSFQLSFHLLGLTMGYCFTWFKASKSIVRRIYMNPRNWWSEFQHCKGSSNDKRGKSRSEPPPAHTIPTNIPLPSTGEEAMKRLLACKGKDAYSILGVTKTCSDDVIKRYYKRQAVLVHPDKNNQPGAEEAFKILIHAFELIGEPEKRKAYDRCIVESHQMDKVWGEFNSLLVQLHKKMEYAANTIRCTNCGQRHRRMRIERPLYAARFCSQCKIRHSSREGDIWAESLFMGWMWKYYACMDGSIYDISDWATCQAENLRHLKPNMHVVQYRIVVGKNRQSSYAPPPPSNYSEPDLDDFLSSLYGQSSGSGGAGGGGNCSASGAGGGDLHNRIRKKSKKKTK